MLSARVEIVHKPLRKVGRGHGMSVIQLSYSFVGPHPDAVAPLKVAALGELTRVTAVWPHRDLAAARRQMATFIAGLAADQRVRCNFTGRDKAASEWVTELRAPPTVASVFDVRHVVVEGQTFARLFGAYTFGESDVVLVADAGAPVSEVYRFLLGWAGYRLGDAAEPAWDKPFPWGYWLVSFAESDVGDADFWALLRDNLRTQHLRDAFDERMAAPAPRVVIEAAGLTELGQGDPSYMIGASEALAQSARHRQLAERHGAGVGDAPSAHDAAGYCDRVFAALEAGERPELFAYREASRGAVDSGWRIGCLDHAHAHDQATLRIAPLSRVAVIPGLVDYLALPPGWVVTFEEGAFWVNAPGQEESHRDG